MPLLDGLRVVRSSIHGYGVVTTRPFTAGELVCFGDGVLYDEDADFDDTYALILPVDDDDPDGTQVFWDLADQTRWFNHSCEPSAEVLTRYADGTVRAWWVALRDLAVGEEITYDYGFAAECAEPCLCGAPTCRGVIVDDDPAVQAELAPAMKALLRSAQPVARASSGRP